MQEHIQNQHAQFIYEEEPIPKIEGLLISALNNHSQQFKISSEQLLLISSNIEDEIPIRMCNYQAEIFHSAIMKLIDKLQPSKTAISSIIQTCNSIIANYYPNEEKIELLRKAKSKNILVLNRLSVAEEHQLFKELINSIEKFQRCLLLRESQLGMVLFIEENISKYSHEDFKSVYQTNFQDIINCIIPAERCHEPINYTILAKMVEIQYSFFDNFSKMSQLLQSELTKCTSRLEKDKLIKLEQQEVVQNLIKRLKIIISKITTIAELFPFACIKSQDDLFSFPTYHPRWKALFDKNIILYKIYGDPEVIDESFKKLRANLNVINAAMNILNEAKDIPKGIKSWGAQYDSAIKVLKCTLSKSKARHQAEIMISDPNESLAKQIWNLPQKKQFKTFIELSLPSIQFSPHIFIPRKIEDYFNIRLNGGYMPLPNFKIDDIEQYRLELYTQKPHVEKLSIRINNQFQLQLRELNKVQLKDESFFTKHIKQVTANLKNIFKQKRDSPKSVIFHIHGGGFISMSSFIHQAYTRNWANSLRVPIVSVDYGKAPQFPYPKGLQDCLEAYLWTLNCMNQIYEFEPVKIILVGDSAGGNLVAALTNLLIKWNLRVPDGIVLCYPALNLDYYDYSPSLLTALNDMILPHTFLKICLKSYLKDPKHKPNCDYLISPLLAPAQILKQYPATQMFVGSKDPFHDDCCRFAQKISNYSHQKVNLTVFQQFPHGFLQFDMKTQPHYFCGQATKEVQTALGELLNKQ